MIMFTRALTIITLTFSMSVVCSGRIYPANAGDAWVSLFNGRDLTGWETYLAAPLGRGKDPNRVFQVVQMDGEPAIRISGTTLGGLATVQGFENYHLELEFKWGQDRHPPRENLPRDSGLLYHCADHWSQGTGWLESLEFGILEGGETSDFWSVPGAHGVRIVVDIEGVDVPVEKRRYPDQAIQFRPGGKKYVATAAGLLNSDDNEKPRGQWNKLELLCVGQTAFHVVNGTVNMVLTNCRRKVDGREEPVTRGRLQLQSEGAEVFYRRLRLRPIKEIPAEYRQALQEPPPNTLTAEERAQRWRLLFDGQTTKGWRGYRKPEGATGWQAKDGALVRLDKAGDLITTEMFDNFELKIDWKISHGGNSGIFYRATEEANAIYETGPEYEIRDNAFWLDDPYTSAANYGLHSPTRDATRPVGYWNRGRIVVQGNHIEHWLNGRKVVDYDLHSPEWQKRMKASKYNQWPRYAKSARGHIGLQDHGDLVWYRNIKIRPLR